MDDLIQACLAARDALDRAYSRHTLAVDHIDLLGDVRAFRRAVDRARVTYREALAAVRESIAAERGWKVSKNIFYLDALAPGRDDGTLAYDRGPIRFNRHVDCFRSPGRGRASKPVAVISHNYATLAECEAFAKAHALHAEPLLRSWSSPRHTAVLFTRAQS